MSKQRSTRKDVHNEFEDTTEAKFKGKRKKRKGCGKTLSRNPDALIRHVNKCNLVLNKYDTEGNLIVSSPKINNIVAEDIDMMPNVLNNNKIQSELDALNDERIKHDCNDNNSLTDYKLMRDKKKSILLTHDEERHINNKEIYF